MQQLCSQDTQSGWQGDKPITFSPGIASRSAAFPRLADGDPTRNAHPKHTSQARNLTTRRDPPHKRHDERYWKSMLTPGGCYHSIDKTKMLRQLVIQEPELDNIGSILMKQSFCCRESSINKRMAVSILVHGFCRCCWELFIQYSTHEIATWFSLLSARKDLFALWHLPEKIHVFFPQNWNRTSPTSSFSAKQNLPHNIIIYIRNHYKNIKERERERCLEWSSSSKRMLKSGLPNLSEGWNDDICMLNSLRCLAKVHNRPQVCICEMLAGFLVSNWKMFHSGTMNLPCAVSEAPNHGVIVFSPFCWLWQFSFPMSQQSGASTPLINGRNFSSSQAVDSKLLSSNLCGPWLEKLQPCKETRAQARHAMWTHFPLGSGWQTDPVENSVSQVTKTITNLLVVSRKQVITRIPDNTRKKNKLWWYPQQQ